MMKERKNVDDDMVCVMFSPEFKLWHGYNVTKAFQVTKRTEFLSVAVADAETGHWLSLTELAESIR